LSLVTSFCSTTNQIGLRQPDCWGI